MTIREQQEAAKRHQFLTVMQFAVLTQYSPKYVYRLVERGAVAVFRARPRGKILIPYPEAVRMRAVHPRADSTLTL